MLLLEKYTLARFYKCIVLANCTQSSQLQDMLPSVKMHQYQSGYMLFNAKMHQNHLVHMLFNARMTETS